MKKTLTTIAFSILIPLVALAQPHGEPSDRLLAMRIAYITDFIGLTSEEAAVFWPLHNEMEAEMEVIRKERAELMMISHDPENLERLSEEELKQSMLVIFDLEQREMDIKRKYHQRFLEALPALKVAKLYRAEEQFKRELIRRFSRERQEHRRR